MHKFKVSTVASRQDPLEILRKQPLPPLSSSPWQPRWTKPFSRPDSVWCSGELSEPDWNGLHKIQESVSQQHPRRWCHPNRPLHAIPNGSSGEWSLKNWINLMPRQSTCEDGEVMIAARKWVNICESQYLTTAIFEQIVKGRRKYFVEQ